MASEAVVKHLAARIKKKTANPSRPTTSPFYARQVLVDSDWILGWPHHTAGVSEAFHGVPPTRGVCARTHTYLHGIPITHR
jgi:hypothetical protein